MLEGEGATFLKWKGFKEHPNIEPSAIETKEEKQTLTNLHGKRRAQQHKPKIAPPQKISREQPLQKGKNNQHSRNTEHYSLVVAFGNTPTYSLVIVLPHSIIVQVFFAIIKPKLEGSIPKHEGDILGQSRQLLSHVRLIRLEPCLRGATIGGESNASRQ
jgi:hypothetical protein